MTGRPAAMPPRNENTEGPPLPVGESLRAILHLEDAPAFVFDLTDAPGPQRMRAQLVAAAERCSASASGWRRSSSALSGKKGISSWLRWIATLNLEHPQSPVIDLAQVTAFHIRRYRGHLETHESVRTRRPLSESTVFDYLSSVRTVLQHSPEVTADSRHELRKRIGGVPATSHVERYSSGDFTEIRNSARRVLSAAHDRIARNHAIADGRVETDDPRVAIALREVLSTGKPSSRDGFKALGALTRERKFSSANLARRALFLSSDEVLAAAVVIASRRGLNLAPVAHARMPYEHEQGVVQLDMDKPRRGSHRHWPEIIADDDDDDDDDADDDDDDDPGPDQRDADLIMMIAEATQPAREYLASIGEPTDRLLIRWSDFSVKPNIGLALERTAAWLPERIVLRFPRLRRSVPGKGVAKEPTDHDASTYLHYVRTDPALLAEQQAAAALGAQAAQDRARKELHIKLLRDRDAPQENDALVANCSDPAMHPESHKPCTLGFYSFLSCLECDNAATVARLLPAQLATIRVLEELRSALVDTWEARFSRSYFTLLAMVERHTEAEVADAGAQVAEHIPRVLSALRVEVPHAI